MFFDFKLLTKIARESSLSYFYYIKLSNKILI